MSDDQWFYVENGSQAGPVSLSDMQQRAKDGLLKPTDLIWKDGMANWLESSQVSEISGGSSPSSEATGGESLAPAAATAVAPAGGAVEYAGFWKRAAAVIIDSVILMIPLFLIGLVFGTSAGSGDAGAARGVGGASNLLSVVISWIYFAGLESSAKQATFGKRILGIKVTDLNGQKLTFARASGRHFAKILSGLILMIGYILAGFTEKKQALHDMIAGTLVVRQ